MGAAGFLAGDWGTSHLRLFLCEADGTVLDTVNGPGAASAEGRFADIFDELAGRWRNVHGTLPAVLCGMVGSSFGWAQVPYVPCPARPEQIAGGCVAVHGGQVLIVPGLSCRNRFNAPDFLRGEETQILGALQLAPQLRRGRHLLCLPGTHSKWVVLDDGRVQDFITAPTGELFALLRDHSVLVRNPPGIEAQVGGTAFDKGVAEFNAFPHGQLLHRLFECRSRMLAGELAAPATSAFLSGLLIASDISGALQLVQGGLAARTVQLIGTPQLTSLYATALATRDYGTQELDGAAAVLAGLVRVQQELTRGVAARVAI